MKSSCQLIRQINQFIYNGTESIKSIYLQKKKKDLSKRFTFKLNVGYAHHKSETRSCR